ncbi:MAG: dienelactone hydrolase family protein [Blastocatellia bacterium]|nr:dienelactone hydrolase family protein [Blastocatellia bacterium]
MRTEEMSFSTANGNTTAYVAMPDEAGSKAVVLIQEWWGLNEHIKDVARRYANEGYVAIAPDLYRGKLAADPEEAGKMMADLQLDDGLDTIARSVSKAREQYGIDTFAVTGFCMGGTYALRAAATSDDFAAAAPFYGDIPEEDVLKGLSTPTLFVSGTKDGWINPEKVGELESAAETHNLPVEVLKYEADHAFFNNTRREVYDKEAAGDAWSRVLEFFRKRL